MYSDDKQSEYQISTSANQKQYPQKIKYQKLPEYQHFFEGTKCCELEDKVDKLKSQSIFYCANVFQKNLNITILDRTQCNQIIKMSVCFACFMFEIKVLNIFQKSQSIYNLKILSQGSHGKVFYTQDQLKQELAIKSIPYSSKNQYSQQPEELTKNLRNSIFEYCLCKLFSILGIGPLIKPLSGFDLIIYQNTVEFCMEVCEKSHFDSNEVLKESLKTMHSFNIIHGDIKPENIMWSPNFQKNVFIDFGLSMLLKERYGQSTFTSFFGTYYYCCQQMKQLMNKGQFGYIDLYYNDTYSLDKFFHSDMEKTTNPKITQNHFQITNQFLNLHLNFQLMHLIYDRNLKQIRQFSKKNAKLFFIQNTIDLLKFTEYQKEVGQIFSQLRTSFSFPSEEQKTIAKFYCFNSFKFEQSFLEKRKILNNRIGQTFSEFKGVVHDIMLFFFIFYNEDITPISLNRSVFLKSKIQQGNIGEPSYWQNFIEYVQNPYVNQQQIFLVFQIIKAKLEIKFWQNNQIQQLSLFAKAHQISEIVRKKYQVDLCNIYKKIQCEQCSQQKFEETKSFFAKIYPFVPELTIKIKQFKKKAKKQYNESMKKDLISDLGQLFHQKQPFYLQLIFQVIDLQFNETSLISFQKIDSFLKYFTNFKLAKKTIAITKYQTYELQRKRNNFTPQSFFEMSTFFYKKNTNLLFSFHYQIRIFLLPFFQILNSETLEDQSFYIKRIQRAVEIGQKINKIYVIEVIAVVFSSIICQIQSLNQTSVFQNIIDCFQENIFLLIRYYNFQIPEFSSNPLCQIFKLAFKKSARNKQFLIKTFQFMDLLENRPFANLCQFILSKVFISYTHEIMSKEQIYQTFRKHFLIIKSGIHRYELFSFVIRFYTNYIFFMNGFGIDLSNQVKQLAQLILKNKYPEDDSFIACYCLATYYCWKKDQFNAYLLFVEKFFNKQLCEISSNNFMAFYTCYVIVQAFIIKKRNRSQAIELIFQFLINSFKSDVELFCKANSNFITILQLILKHQAANKNEKFITKCLYVASLLVNKCSPSFSMFFKKEMTYLIFHFVKKGIFKFCQRSRDLKCLQLIRSSHFSYTPFEFIDEIGKTNRIRGRIRNKMMEMVANRKKNMNIGLINLHYEIVKLYQAFCNMEHSYSFPFEQQQKIINRNCQN